MDNIEDVGTASLHDVKRSLEGALNAKGVIPRLRAALRKEVYELFEPKGTKADHKLPNESLIVNELIREYLEFHGYSNSLAVFMDESGQPEETKPLRSMLEYQFAHLSEEQLAPKGPYYGQKVPLLYAVTAAASRRIPTVHGEAAGSLLSIADQRAARCTPYISRQPYRKSCKKAECCIYLESPSQPKPIKHTACLHRLSGASGLTA